MADTAEETIQAYITAGSKRGAAKLLNISVPAFKGRLESLQKRNIYIPTMAYGLNTHAGREDITVDNGVIVAGSDAHIWDETPTAAMLALRWFCDKYRSDIKAIVLDGDIIDGSKLSRHMRIGWEKAPNITEEIGGVQKQLRVLKNILGDGAKRYWPAGNHDMRLETQIANTLPALEGLQGVHLKDHFPDWIPCWSIYVNEFELEITHRFRGGVHAAWNNVLYNGISIATGHTHRALTRPFTTKRGTTYGVELGMLGKPYTNQFVHYTEANAVNWQSGFGVFTFNNGRLLWPEHVIVIDDHSWMFRGEIITI